MSCNFCVDSFSVCLTGCGKDTQSSVSATEKTTAVAASQPVTKAATSDEQTQEPTWNYSELKRKSSDISENLDAIITDNKFRERFMSKLEMLLSISVLTDFPIRTGTQRILRTHALELLRSRNSLLLFAVMQLVEEESFHLMIQSTNIFRHINTAKKSPLKTCLQ